VQFPSEPDCQHHQYSKNDIGADEECALFLAGSGIAREVNYDEDDAAEHREGRYFVGHPQSAFHIGHGAPHRALWRNFQGLYRLPVHIGDAFARAARKASIGDLSSFGLSIPDEGVFTRDLRGQSPTLLDMDVIDAVQDGSIKVVEALESVEGDKVVLEDGGRLDPDVVIASTGASGAIWHQWSVTSACSTPTAAR
jgi:hypothetical protein